MPFIPETPIGDYIVRGITPGKDGGLLDPYFATFGTLTSHTENPGIRQELREFKKNKDLWNLYLLGFWQFQLIPQNHLLSYFQIAGETPPYLTRKLQLKQCQAFMGVPTKHGPRTTSF
jgi:tyrosinase